MTSALRGLLAATVLVAVTPSAMAADSSLGVSLGYVKPKSIDSTLVFSGDFRFHLNRVFALSPEFSYWKESQSAVGVSTSIQDLQFGVNLLAVLPVGRRVEFFVGEAEGFTTRPATWHWPARPGCRIRPPAAGWTCRGGSTSGRGTT